MFYGMDGLVCDKNHYKPGQFFHKEQDKVFHRPNESFWHA